MTKEQAQAKFLELVRRYGLNWTAAVPREAYEQMNAVSQVLSSDEKREALRS